MNDDDLMTIEDCAQSAKTTWRTARRRLDESGVRPVKVTKKSALYPRTAALRAVCFPESRDLEMVDKLLGFIGEVLVPKLFGSQSHFLRYAIGLLRELGCTKAEALQHMGAMQVMFSETIERDVLPGNLLMEKCDWWQLAAEISDETGLTGLPMMEEYVKRHWPDAPE